MISGKYDTDGHMGTIAISAERKLKLNKAILPTKQDNKLNIIEETHAQPQMEKYKDK